MTIENFEALNDEMKTLVNVYYGAAVMVKDAFAKLHELETADNVKFNKVYNMTDAQAQHLIKVVKNNDDKDFYSKCYEASKYLNYCETMLVSARTNYENKVLFGDKVDCITSFLLFKQVEDLNVTLPEEVKNLIVEAVNDNTINGRMLNNRELARIITDMFN